MYYSSQIVAKIEPGLVWSFVFTVLQIVPIFVKAVNTKDENDRKKRIERKGNQEQRVEIKG